MRDYDRILKNITDPQKTDFDIYNESGGQPGSDPKEAVATMRAISLYRKSDLSFAEQILKHAHDAHDAHDAQKS